MRKEKNTLRHKKRKGTRGDRHGSFCFWKNGVTINKEYIKNSEKGDGYDGFCNGT